jgi:hypothetical protein
MNLLFFGDEGMLPFGLSCLEATFEIGTVPPTTVTLTRRPTAVNRLRSSLAFILAQANVYHFFL